MTLPVSVSQTVIGKFLAAWIFTGIALILTFPMWITVNYLGNPDNGVILTSYLGSLLMAGGYLSIGSCISSLTKNQVIAFVVSIAVCFIYSKWAANCTKFFLKLDSTSSSRHNSFFSFVSNFIDLTRGVIDIRNIIYFLSLIIGALSLNVLSINSRKGI